jgi:hypothetical protein
MPSPFSVSLSELNKNSVPKGNMRTTQASAALSLLLLLPAIPFQARNALANEVKSKADTANDPHTAVMRMHKTLSKPSAKPSMEETLSFLDAVLRDARFSADELTLFLGQISFLKSHDTGWDVQAFNANRADAYKGAFKLTSALVKKAADTDRERVQSLLTKISAEVLTVQNDTDNAARRSTLIASRADRRLEIIDRLLDKPRITDREIDRLIKEMDELGALSVSAKAAAYRLESAKPALKGVVEQLSLTTADANAVTSQKQASDNLTITSPSSGNSVFKLPDSPWEIQPSNVILPYQIVSPPSSDARSALKIEYADRHKFAPEVGLWRTYTITNISTRPVIFVFGHLNMGLEGRLNIVHTNGNGPFLPGEQRNTEMQFTKMIYGASAGKWCGENKLLILVAYFDDYEGDGKWKTNWLNDNLKTQAHREYDVLSRALHNVGKEYNKAKGLPPIPN